MPPKAYEKYRKTRYLKKDERVCCPHCSSSEMTLDVYLKNHLPQVHDFNGKLTCPFCLEYRWKRKEITTEVVNVHLMTCMKQTFTSLFPPPRNVPEPPPPQQSEPPPQQCRMPTLPCKECVPGLQLQRGTPNERYGSFCQDVGMMPPFMKPPFLSTHVSFYEWSGLGDFMCPIIREFEKKKKDYLWYHISVRAIVWDEFVKHIANMKGVYLLPYWCLCNGGKSPNPAIRNHRHMVLVKDKKNVQLDKIWTKYMKCGNSLSKFKKPIIKREHLINTLFYVSQPRGKCDGTAKRKFKIEGEPPSHYFRNIPLYHHAKVPMWTLVKQGLKDYIKLRRQNSSPNWYKHVEGKGLARNIPVYLLGIEIEGCILPLAKNLEFSHMTDEAPDDCPYLWMYDKAMVLRVNPALTDMTREEWCNHQKNTGNSFLDAVHDNKYILGWLHRLLLNFGAYVEKNCKEEWDNQDRSELYMAHETLEYMKSDFEKCLQERDTFKQERYTFRQERDAFKQERDTFKHERDKLKMQLEYFEKTVKAVEEVRREMKAEMNAMKQMQMHEMNAMKQQYEDRLQKNEDRIQRYENKESERNAQLEAEIESLRRANETHNRTVWNAS